jgi:uncharacterized membrane protein YdjX (TVP38/TMEM64 family)
MAGLARMRFARFIVALLLGTVPMAAVFATVGAMSARQPGWGIAIAVAVPLVLWPIFLYAVRPR